MLSKKAVLQSVCNNYEDLINVTSPHNAEYADKIGFDYILHKNLEVLGRSIAKHDRAPAWNKIYSIKYLFEKGYDQIFLLDGDAVVVDKEKNVLDLKEGKEDKSIHICCDGLGKTLIHVNTGVIFIEKNKYTVQFIENVINTPNSLWHNTRNWEQNAIHEEFDKAEFLYTKIVQLYDSDYFNHNSDWVFHPCWVQDKENRTSAEKISLIKKKLKHPKQDVLKMG